MSVFRYWFGIWVICANIWFASGGHGLAIGALWLILAVIAFFGMNRE